MADSTPGAATPHPPRRGPGPAGAPGDGPAGRPPTSPPATNPAEGLITLLIPNMPEREMEILLGQTAAALAERFGPDARIKWTSGPSAARPPGAPPLDVLAGDDGLPDAERPALRLDRIGREIDGYASLEDPDRPFERGREGERARAIGRLRWIIRQTLFPALRRLLGAVDESGRTLPIPRGSRVAYARPDGSLWTGEVGCEEPFRPSRVRGEAVVLSGAGAAVALARGSECSVDPDGVLHPTPAEAASEAHDRDAPRCSACGECLPCDLRPCRGGGPHRAAAAG